MKQLFTISLSLGTRAYYSAPRASEKSCKKRDRFAFSISKECRYILKHPCKCYTDSFTFPIDNRLTSFSSVCRPVGFQSFKFYCKESSSGSYINFEESSCQKTMETNFFVQYHPRLLRIRDTPYCLQNFDGPLVSKNVSRGEDFLKVAFHTHQSKEQSRAFCAALQSFISNFSFPSLMAHIKDHFTRSHLCHISKGQFLRYAGHK